MRLAMMTAVNSFHYFVPGGNRIMGYHPTWHLDGFRIANMPDNSNRKGLRTGNLFLML
jgi:hypothetical protein